MKYQLLWDMTSCLCVFPEASTDSSAFIFCVLVDCLDLKMTPRSLYSLNDSVTFLKI
jgi:hypothetical protein